MLKILLALLIGLSNLSKTTPCVAQYGQCDGLQYTGTKECCVPSICEYSNPWFSQCIPSSAPPIAGCSAVYSQCGGQNWSGPTCCDYSTCIYSNHFYSQCLPTSASSLNSASSTDYGCSALYAQCSGIGWNGPTTCCNGTTCSYGNDYYWQCLPTGGSSSSSSGSVSSTTIASSSGPVGGQAGITTRYWDCCKASCGWAGKASVTNPVETCAQDSATPVDVNTQSGCNGGSAYMCNNQQPWNVSSTLSYGYAAANIIGEGESDWCCACYALTFTSGPVAGKVMIVQVTNTGGDLGNNHFDLQMPGGGFGLFDGCTNQFGSSYYWGAQYGGVSSRADCDNLPAVLQSGCYWRFDWFMNAHNPTISFKQVTCPSVLTANTQCIRV